MTTLRPNRVKAVREFLFAHNTSLISGAGLSLKRLLSSLTLSSVQEKVLIFF